MIPLIAFLGLISGYFLALIAPEEIKPGYKYLVIWQNILISVAIGFVFSGFISVIVAVMVILLLLMKNLAPKLYIFSGLLIFLADNQLVMAVLVFLFGMPIAGTAAYDYVKKDKINEKMASFHHLIKNYIWYLPIAYIPYITTFFL